MTTNRGSLVWRSGDAFVPEKLRRFLGTFVYGNYSAPVYINYWSFVHVMSGIALAALFIFLEPYFPTARIMNNPYLYGFIVHTVWELWQIAIGMSRPFSAQGHNGITDIVLDTAFFMAGMGVVLEGRELIKRK